MRWTALQGLLVERCECAREVRAVVVAAMVSCTVRGEYADAAEELLPTGRRALRCAVEYDALVEEGMVTVLADPRTAKGRIFIVCGTVGCCAEPGRGPGSDPTENRATTEKRAVHRHVGSANSPTTVQ